MAVAFSLALDELLCSPQATTHPIYESGLNLIRQSFFLCVLYCFQLFHSQYGHKDSRKVISFAKI